MHFQGHGASAMGVYDLSTDAVPKPVGNLGSDHRAMGICKHIAFGKNQCLPATVFEMVEIVTGRADHWKALMVVALHNRDCPGHTRHLLDDFQNFAGHACTGRAYPKHRGQKDLNVIATWRDDQVNAGG